MSEWLVQWLGDPAYEGEDEFDDLGIDPIEARSSREAAGIALAGWRKMPPGGYGKGTVIGVRQFFPPPPVERFVVDENGVPVFDSEILP